MLFYIILRNKFYLPTISLGLFRSGVRITTARERIITGKFSMCSKPKNDILSDSSSIVYLPFDKVVIEKMEIISKSLKCSTLDAIQLINNHNEILLLQNTYLEMIAKFFSDKLTISDLKNHPHILTSREGFSERKYQLLHDIGITNITSYQIIKYKAILSLNTETLYKNKLLPIQIDPIANMLSVLKWPQGRDSTNLAPIFQGNWKEKPIREIKEQIISVYIAERLDCDFELMNKNLNIYGSIRSRPLLWIKRVLDYLTCDFGFTPKLVKSHLYLLRTNPDAIYQILKLPSIGLTPTKEVVRMQPRIIASKAHDIKKVEQILREYNFNDSQMKNHLMIYVLSPQTVRKRLELIKRNEDLQLTSVSQRHLNLVTCYKRASSRMHNFRKKGNLDTLSLNMMLTKNECYQAHLLIQRPRAYFVRECVVFLSQVFGRSESEIRKQLKSHPYLRKVNYVNCVKIVEKLTEFGITHEQIWNSLFVILYDVDEVLDHLQRLKTFPELQPYSEWKNHDFLLELVIYYIEKSKYFTGKGIYQPNNSKSPNIKYDTSVTDND